MFVELAVITLGWTFNALYNVMILQVIWAIGWSMVILGLLVRTSNTVILVTGLLLFFGHNLLDYAEVPQQGTAGVLWTIFFRAAFTFFPAGQNRGFLDIYAILPWTSVMLLGYSMGRYFVSSYDVGKRKKTLVRLGFTLIAIFLVLRLINLYGDPQPWSHQKDGLFTFLSFINTTKYPVSLLYLCMTIGPSLLILAIIERVQHTFTRVLTIYGKVPFLYYVLHFYIIHTIGVILFFATGHGTNEIINPNMPFLFRPQHYGFDLCVVYMIGVFVGGVLYWQGELFSLYRASQ